MKNEEPDQLSAELAEEAKADPDYPTRVWAAAAAQVLIIDLVDARQKAGISQADIARRLKTSRGYIHKLENRMIDPALGTVARYAAMVGYRLELKRIPKRRRLLEQLNAVILALAAGGLHWWRGTA